MSKPIALVTGASKGLGLAIANRLIKEGYEVYGTTRNPSTVAEENDITYLKLELDDERSINELFEQLPKVDLLINNAGYSQIGSIEETSLESMKKMFDINLFNQILLTQKYIPQMRERQSGTIINITSMAGTIPVPFSTMYAAVKSAFDAFTKGLRNELIKYNVRVFAVAPFQMNTKIPQTKDYFEESPYQKDLLVTKIARDKALSNSEDPDYIAKQLIDLLRTKNPPSHNAAGVGSWRKNWIIKHLPLKMVERMVRKRFDLDY